ncbi:MAG TPA: uroporphyrinogen decarboxylase family protein [Armatimonadota bacterium]|jgi:uroporphyrinogen decarboxylase
MTPRERMIAALRFEPYDGPVPHMELEFQLSEELFGQRALMWGDYDNVPKHKRRDALVANAKLWIRVAEHFDYSIITGLHWLPVDAQCESFGIIRELSGRRFMLSVLADGTMSIPAGSEIAEVSFRMADDPDSLVAVQEDRCKAMCANYRTLLGAGAEIVFMTADYCFNSGPFLSPRMFRQFITPFLRRQVDVIHDCGGFAVKHTDGNLWPIMDQLVETGIDGLHSIDPMAGMDIAKVREFVGDRVCLFGNVDCSKLQSGTPDEIEESARYCLEHGPLNGTGYCFTSSNCVFQGMPMEAYCRMLAVRDEWSRGHTSAA